MIGKTLVSVLVALALLVSILELSSLASERRMRSQVPAVDPSRPELPVASELDDPSSASSRAEITF